MAKGSVGPNACTIKSVHRNVICPAYNPYAHMVCIRHIIRTHKVIKNLYTNCPVPIFQHLLRAHKSGRPSIPCPGPVQFRICCPHSPGTRRPCSDHAQGGEIVGHSETSIKVSGMTFDHYCTDTLLLLSLQFGQFEICELKLLGFSVWTSNGGTLPQRCSR